LTTPDQHNKYLGISHLVHGGLLLVLILFMLTFMTVAMSLSPGPGAPPPVFMVFMWLFFGGFYGLMSLPSLVAGYGLLKRKPWARTASIIGAVTAAMSFPIGTAVCAYTFWFLFSEPGKLLYDRPRFTLPPFGNLPEAGTQQRRDGQYLPPPTPPDWR
jgi:hypothetical protein